MTHRIGFDTELDGHDICIEFDRRTTWSTDHHYGADADGNRGISVTEIDVDNAENVTVSWYDEATGNAHNDIPLAELTEAQRTGVQALLDAWLEANEPGGPEYDEPDHEPEPEDADDY